jgi:hypothetical protein
MDAADLNAITDPAALRALVLEKMALIAGKRPVRPPSPRSCGALP